MSGAVSLACLWSVIEETEHSLEAFRPRRVLIAGNATEQLTSRERRKSFELWRASTEVDVVTYDELFRKAEILAELFGLKRAPKKWSASATL